MDLYVSGGHLKFEDSRKLALILADSLVASTGLNEFMERILPLVGRRFGTEKLCLVDFDEHANHFDLLHFGGYSTASRYTLQRRFSEFEVTRALSERKPYRSLVNPSILCLPFYFRDILEAVLVLELSAPFEPAAETLEISALLSKFLGLFMSSTRLEVNRRRVLESSDLLRARQIQLGFLPRRAPRDPGCEVYGFNSASNLVGGDYYDFFDHRDDSLQCVLADACGHGMAAALIMSNFRGLLQSEIGKHADFARLFTTLNQLVYLDEELIQYLTGVFLHYDRPTQTLQYLNAGHYDPIVLTARGEVRSLPGGGPPLGMFRNSQYQAAETVLHPGDLVLLYTDGIVDLQNERGEYFGTEGVVRSTIEHRSLALEDLGCRVLESARRFAKDQPFEDDVTLFFMRVR